MHPQIRQDHPGVCPICGMALEPVLPSLDDDHPELRDFSRRFWRTLPLTAIVFVLAMFGHRLHLFDMTVQSWVELVLATPVVLTSRADSRESRMASCAIALMLAHRYRTMPP